MAEVIWHAGEAAGLPPLDELSDRQDHLQRFMEGEIPNADKAPPPPASAS